MSKRAKFTEKHMRAIAERRGMGYSWNDVAVYMSSFHRLNHNATTYMRHYKKWKLENEIDEEIDGILKPSLWERIKSFFGI